MPNATATKGRVNHTVPHRPPSRQPTARPVKAGMFAPKLTEANVLAIREEWDPANPPLTAMAKQYGVSRVLIWMVITRRIWKGVAAGPKEKARIRRAARLAAKVQTN